MIFSPPKIKKLMGSVDNPSRPSSAEIARCLISAIDNERTDVVQAIIDQITESNIFNVAFNIIEESRKTYDTEMEITKYNRQKEFPSLANDSYNNIIKRSAQVF